MGEPQSDVVGSGPARVVDGWVARHEKPLLIVMAAAMPRRVLPDHLTIVGLFGAVLTAAGLIGIHWTAFGFVVALTGLMVNWFGDSLDGTLARVRRLERHRYGFFVDHTSDLLSLFLIVIGLGCSPLMRHDTALLVLAAYLTFNVYTMVKVHAMRVMQLSYFGIGPTEIRVLIGLGLMISWAFGTPAVGTPIGTVSLFDTSAIGIFCFMLVMLPFIFRNDARILAKIDPNLHRAPEEVRMVEIRGSGPGQQHDTPSDAS